ncbi:MAG: biotin transporter BioY [Thermoflexus hugenholtzii]|jgi:biotin transport system substrate-specific component|uniref:biotin transporter BioY n=1 Tax=Thermoflexus TaxID=1495649 RepID=UPI001C752487|nr:MULTISPECIES: biotin transporter BioY [Thermoflexus]QWK11391.1 MAG: biotin transporter BioY [Thermoflexus hugenholtzii]
MVLSDLLIPAALRRTRAQQRLADAVLILGGSLLTALMARVEIPLPFTPVPITGQTFAVLLVGAALGSRRGALSMAVYLLEGALGLPVFAGGAAGLARLRGPTGGYLIGFIAAAFVTGWLAERGWDRRPATTALAMLTGNAVIYLFGLPWLAWFVGGFLGPKGALALGLLPFVPGDLLKLLLATLAFPSAWLLVRHARAS